MDVNVSRETVANETCQLPHKGQQWRCMVLAEATFRSATYRPEAKRRMCREKREQRRRLSESSRTNASFAVAKCRCRAWLVGVLKDDVTAVGYGLAWRSFRSAESLWATQKTRTVPSAHLPTMRQFP